MPGLIFLSIMQVKLPILHPFTSGYAVDLNRTIGVTKIFKTREESSDRGYCVYIFENQMKIACYYGMGRYYDLTSHKMTEWKKSRPFNHRNDNLAKVIGPGWTCRIYAMGLTKTEAHIIEAILILNAKRPLSKIGQDWDGVSLINKRRERKYERMINVYINGNYTGIAA